MINYHEFSIENRIFLLENFYGSLKRHMENLFDIDLRDRRDTFQIDEDIFHFP